MNKRYDINDFVPTVTEQSITRELVKRVKQRRKELSLTQKELSVQSGVSYGSIRRFETQGEISLQAFMRISSVLKSLEDFNELYKFSIIKDIRR